MNDTWWKKALCSAVAAAALLCSAAAADAADSAAEGTGAVPAEKRLLRNQPLPDKQIAADEAGRLFVSDETLAYYGICGEENGSGKYVLNLPPADGGTELWRDGRVSLRLPGGGNGAVDIGLIAGAIGLDYTGEGTKRKLILPEKRAETAPRLRRITGDAVSAAKSRKDAGKQKKRRRTGKEEPAAAQERKIGVVLLWDPDMNQNSSLPELPNTKAVMSPCAFRLTRQGVELRHDAFDRLAASYRDKGYAVWPLVDNHFDPVLTHAVLADEALQEQIIKELIGYAVLYDFKGYNLDFENVDYADKDRLTAFVGKMGAACRAYGLTLSMDVTPLSNSPNWSLVYDRAALAPSLDYMMVMAYDQFPRTSAAAGPTASYPWVEQAVKDITALVPAEKIILGMPLYMRLWYESNDGKELPRSAAEWPPAAAKAGKAKAGQKPKLQVRTLTMAGSRELRERYGPYIRWDENLRLYILELPLPSGTVKVWFEDETSLREKTKLISAYGLGGASFWRKGFEPPDFWQAFAEQELT